LNEATSKRLKAEERKRKDSGSCKEPVGQDIYKKDPEDQSKDEERV